MGRKNWRVEVYTLKRGTKRVEEGSAQKTELIDRTEREQKAGIQRAVEERRESKT